MKPAMMPLNTDAIDDAKLPPGAGGWIRANFKHGIPNWCGQTVLVMLAECSIEEAIVATQCGGGTCGKDLIVGMKNLGVKSATRTKRGDTEKPNAILHVTDGVQWSHWILKWDGVLYDPMFGIIPSVERRYPKGRVDLHIPLRH